MEMQAGWLGVPTPEVAPPDASADDGLAVGLAALPGEVIHTPGHTPGSICLLFHNSICCLRAIRSLPDRSGGPIFPGAMDVRSCAPCVIACWYCPIPPAFCRATARRRLLARKDNQIRFFSQIFECDTLSVSSRFTTKRPKLTRLGLTRQDLVNSRSSCIYNLYVYSDLIKH